MAGQSSKQLYDGFSLTLNPLTASDPTLPPLELDELRKDLETLPPCNWKKAGVPASAIALRGPQGPIAYLKNSKTLIVEVPLSFTADKQRTWANRAATFFREIVTASVEAPPQGRGFQRITRGQFSTAKYRQGPDLKTAGHAPVEEMRTRSYAQRAEYPDPNTEPRCLRDTWIRKTYADLIKRHNEADASRILTEKLARKRPEDFGTWRTKRLKPVDFLILKQDTLLRIARTRPA